MSRTILHILGFLLLFHEIFAQDTTSVPVYKNSFETYSIIEAGDFTNWNEARQLFKTGALIRGSKTLKNSAISGLISYENRHKNGIVWPILYNYYTPYLIVDLIEQDFIENEVGLVGNYSYILDSNTKSSVHLSYNTGSKYNKRDPRYKTDFYTFSFKPSINLKLSELNLMLSPEYSKGKTELNMSAEKQDRFLVIYQS